MAGDHPLDVEEVQESHWSRQSHQVEGVARPLVVEEVQEQGWSHRSRLQLDVAGDHPLDVEVV